MTTPAIAYPKGVTIFGREPATVLGFIEATLALAISFGVGQALGVSQEFYGPFIALVSAAIGAYTAWATKDTGLSYVTGFVRAGVALLAVYGFTITDAQLGTLLAFVTVVVAFWTRTQTSPVAFPAEPSPAQVVPVPATEDVKADIQRVAEEATAAANEVLTEGEVSGDGALSEEEAVAAWYPESDGEVDALPGGGDAVRRTEGF